MKIERCQLYRKNLNVFENIKRAGNVRLDLKRAGCSIGYLILIRCSWEIVAQDLQIQEVPCSAEGCRLYRSASGSRLYRADCWLPCVACLATRVVYDRHWSGGYARHRNVRCINSALFWESRNTTRARPPAAPPDGQSYEYGQLSTNIISPHIFKI